jgi:uncharacterized membrane protein
MKILNCIKKHNRGGLIGGLIYIGLGAISLTSYFMEKKGINTKFLKPENQVDSETINNGISQQKINILQN